MPDIHIGKISQFAALRRNGSETAKGKAQLIYAITSSINFTG